MMKLSRLHRPIKRTLRNVSNCNTTKQKFCVLDLRPECLSVMERLCLEECILRHDNRQWIIFGTHDPTQSRFLRMELPSYVQETTGTPSCIIVMGIGGKPELLLDIDKVRQDGVWVIKRFSGGGTVVVDRNCLYSTIIGRNDQLSHVPPYPREIMDWTATDIFGPTFQMLKQKAMQKNPTLEYPEFALKENDYVLGETQKVAGNAQSIVKSGFLHHTTFLWSYSPDNMQYLTLPAKRPDYRKDRSHSSFLIQLKDAYHNQLQMNAFFDSLAEVCNESFETEVISAEEAFTIVSDVVGKGDLQAFFEKKGRTRLVDLP